MSSATSLWHWLGDLFAQPLLRAVWWEQSASRPADQTVAGSLIGEIGALGGGLLPNALGLSKQYIGSCLLGFVAFAPCAAAMLVLLRFTKVS